MTITVRFFAAYRQLTGVDRLELEVAPAATVTDVINQLEQRYPLLAGKLQTNALVALNERYVQRETALQPNDTAAFFPPVSGG